MKQLPPKPGPEFKNLLPILVSVPIAFETSFMSAPVFSQSALMEFIELILWARNAFATNLANSLLHKLVSKILSFGTQFSYISDNVSMASIFSPPISTLSDL